MPEDLGAEDRIGNRKLHELPSILQRSRLGTPPCRVLFGRGMLRNPIFSPALAINLPIGI